jgi:hypothetical protein
MQGKMIGQQIVRISWGRSPTAKQVIVFRVMLGSSTFSEIHPEKVLLHDTFVIYCSMNNYKCLGAALFPNKFRIKCCSLALALFLALLYQVLTLIQLIRILLLMSAL